MTLDMFGKPPLFDLRGHHADIDLSSTFHCDA
jgi:hypothetical protein